MKLEVGTISLLAAMMSAPSGAAEQPPFFLKFPAADSESLGQIDSLTLTVSCSWIATLQNVPELHNIEMGYEIPAENFLRAGPRLGAAAVYLSSWSDVIGIRIPTDADARSCFTVKVHIEDREGVTRDWLGTELGLPNDA